MNKITTLMAAAAAALILAACGGSAAQHSASASSAPQSRPALTCDEISGDLSNVLLDLKTEDKHLQEAWVSGGDSGDLKALIDETQSAVTGGNTLNSDAATFNQDASTYLDDNSPYLAPGWQSGYSTVTDDINALATDCGQPRVKANTPQNS
ncbi:MAG TPA: hypothetical protein VMV92_39320 [Streptosporangiaceae bacterium]|nr:hypothetical protein [Streptosporangiaceae bacterium]